MPTINTQLQAHITNKGHGSTINADGDVTITGTLDAKQFSELERAALANGYVFVLASGALKAIKQP